MPAVMRPNYDKYHRCPAWSGPAMRGSARKGAPKCASGTLPDRVYHRRFANLRTNRCPKCGTIVLPFAIRYLDPTLLWTNIKFMRTKRQWKRARP